MSSVIYPNAIVVLDRIRIPAKRRTKPAQGQEHTYCTPKSPVEKTSIRFRPKQANISTLQRPKPRTATSLSMSSASLALISIWALSSPEANFSARPEMYSALRCERPAVRRVGRSFVMTWAGEGKAGCVSSNKPVNFFLMEAAAAPETYCCSVSWIALRTS